MHVKFHQDVISHRGVIALLLPKFQQIVVLSYKLVSYRWNSMKLIRAYSGSEFVVANSLAKWKKLEPNEINFSQGFSKKVVSTS